MRRLLAFLVCFACGASALAQRVNRDTMVVRALVEPGRVQLRWSPPLQYTFYEGLEDGYLIERRTPGGEWETLFGGPVLSAPFDSIRALAERETYAGLFGMAMRPDSLTEAPLVKGEQEQGFKTSEERYQLVSLAYLSTIYSQETALASGLFAYDFPAVGIYEYRINPPASTQGVRPGVITVDLDERTPPVGVDSVFARWGDRIVDLVWRLPADDRVAYVNVVRSSRLDTAWTMVNTAPLLGAAGLQLTIQDSLADNQTEYAYRILAYDYFHSAPVSYAPIVGTGQEPPDIPAPFIDSIYEVPDSTVVLRWSLDPVQDETVIGQIIGFEVEHSLVADAGYRSIAGRLPAGTRQWEETIDDGRLHYYRVAAVDSVGRRVRSTPRSIMLIDSMPPAPPEGLTMEVDREGAVLLTWRANTEPDFASYRIFFAHGPKALPQRKNRFPVRDTAFVDTLNLVNYGDSAYYRLAALDIRGNVSELSAPVALALPDVAVPLAPVLVSAEGDTSGVRITFQPSSSTDVVDYLWQRRLLGTQDFITFREQDSAFAKTGLFVDDVGPGGSTYEYRVEVRDEMAFRSFSNVVRGTHFLPPVLPPITSLSAKRDPETNVLQLTWQYDLDRRLARFRIVRAVADRPFETLSLLDIDQISRKGPNRKDGSYLWRIEDKTANLGTEYRYGIQAESADGRVSKIVEL